MNISKKALFRWGRFLGTTFLLVAIFLPLLTLSANAAGRDAPKPKTTFDWVNSTTIKANNWVTGTGYTTITFVSTDASTNPTRTFSSDYIVEGCTGNKLVLNSSDLTRAQLTKSYVDHFVRPAKCLTNQDGGTITVGSVTKAGQTPPATPSGGYSTVTYAWANTETINARGSVNDEFSASSPTTYKRANGPVDTCPDTITLASETKTDSGTLKEGQTKTARGCTGGTNHAITISGTENGPSGGDASATSPKCETSGFALGFIFCPFINGLSSAIDGIYGSFIKPLLVTSPIDTTGTADCTGTDNFKGCDYKVWSNFRIYGNIFLIIALLVVVFGQSIGGGLIDAYTAKKILPRLLAAVILINLSIYIVAFMVDITNIVGSGIQTLLSKPFENAGAFKLSLNGGTSATLGISALLGGGAAVGTIWAAIAAPAAAALVAAELLPPLVMFLALFILLPGFLIFVAILGTVIIRRGLIIFLVLVSPVAFALYCLPNTEKYFKQWWSLLIKTLLVYPIIAIIFTIADILSITIQQGGSSSGLLEWVSQLLSIAALIIPLFLIPFAFKFAGGFIGRAYETANTFRNRSQEAIKGNANDQNSLRNRVKRNSNNAIIDQRASLQNVTRNKRGLSTIGRIAGGGSRIFDLQAQNLKESAARMEVTSSNGNDAYQKASTISQSDADQWKADALTAGDTSGDVFRYKVKDGVEQWASADGGGWYDKPTIKEGRRAHSTQSERQRAFSLVLQKAQFGTSQQQEDVLTDYLSYADSAGLDKETAIGRWQGIAIPYKGVRMDLRRASFEKNPTTNKFERTGTSHQALLTEFGGSSMGELGQETTGTANAIETSIKEVFSPTKTRTVVEQQKLEKAAVKAYYNMGRYANGDTSALAAAAGGAAYASSSGAANKNALAFREAYKRLSSDPAISSFMTANEMLQLD